MLAAAVPDGPYGCHRCGEPVAFTARGWVHQGGGAYVVRPDGRPSGRCADCGWRGAPYPSPARCPQCGSRELRDDHCAQPLRRACRQAGS